MVHMNSTVICNIYESVSDLLPHFLKHYISHGITRFIFGIHKGTQNPVWNTISSMMPPTISYRIIKSYDEEISARHEGISLNKLRELCDTQWIVPTDLDEFHIPVGYESFYDLAIACEQEGAECVHSIMQDQITENGNIPLTIDSDIPILNQFPLSIDLTKKILGACNKKICLSKQYLTLNDGHHYIGNGSESNFSHKLFSKNLITQHFKWFGDLHTKETKKHKRYSEIGAYYADENKKLLDYMNHRNGKLL